MTGIEIKMQNDLPEFQIGANCREVKFKFLKLVKTSEGLKYG